MLDGVDGAITHNDWLWFSPLCCDSVYSRIEGGGEGILDTHTGFVSWIGRVSRLRPDRLPAASPGVSRACVSSSLITSDKDDNSPERVLDRRK